MHLLAWRAVTGDTPHQWELWQFPVKGTTPTRAPGTSRVQEQLFAASPIVLDSRVAFHRDGDVWLRAESIERNLTRGRLGPVRPLCWLDDGSRLACRSADDKVWSLASDGSPDDRLVAELRGGASATWTPVSPAEWLPHLPDAPAEVNADTVPPGAEVYVNRHLKGITPCSFAVTSAEQYLKPYTVSFLKDFLRIEERELCLRRGQRSNVSVRLTHPLTMKGASDELKQTRNAVRHAIIHRDGKLLASVVSPEGLRSPGGPEALGIRLLSREQVRGAEELVEIEFFRHFRAQFLSGWAVDAPGGEEGEGWRFWDAGEIQILREDDDWRLWGFSLSDWWD